MKQPSCRRIQHNPKPFRRKQLPVQLRIQKIPQGIMLHHRAVIHDSLHPPAEDRIQKKARRQRQKKGRPADALPFPTARPALRRAARRSRQNHLTMHSLQADKRQNHCQDQHHPPLMGHISIDRSRRKQDAVLHPTPFPFSVKPQEQKQNCPWKHHQIRFRPGVFAVQKDRRIQPG